MPAPVAPRTGHRAGHGWRGRSRVQHRRPDSGTGAEHPLGWGQTPLSPAPLLQPQDVHSDRCLSLSPPNAPVPHCPHHTVPIAPIPVTPIPLVPTTPPCTIPSPHPPQALLVPIPWPNQSHHRAGLALPEVTSVPPAVARPRLCCCRAIFGPFPLSRASPRAACGDSKELAQRGTWLWCHLSSPPAQTRGHSDTPIRTGCPGDRDRLSCGQSSPCCPGLLAASQHGGALPSLPHPLMSLCPSISLP